MMIQHIMHLRSVVSKNSHPVFAEGMWLGRDCIYFMTHPCSFLRSLSGMVEWFGFGNEANFETVVERMCYCWEEFTGCHRPVSVPFPGEGTLLGYGRHGPAASDNFYLYPLSSTYQQYIFLHKLMSSSLSPEGRMKLQQQAICRLHQFPGGNLGGGNWAEADVLPPGHWRGGFVPRLSHLSALLMGSSQMLELGGT